MLSAVIRWADGLDTWLKATVGWPYNTILGIGLGTSIAATVNAITQAAGSPKDIAGHAAMLVFEVGLLINQLAQLHHMREARRARRAAQNAPQGTSGS
jgi:hypothetical protein